MRKAISSFSSGEVSDLTDDRSTLDAVKRGLKTLTNAELGRYGHLDKRPGTDHIGTIKATDDVRLESFEFSAFTKFVLEFGPSYLRFWSNDVQVTVNSLGAWSAIAYTVGQIVTESTINYYCLEAHTGGVFATDLAAEKWYALEDAILEVPTPYVLADLHEFQTQPVQDFIYISHPDHPIKILKRYADDDWRLEAHGFTGPYEEGDEDDTFNASAATGTITVTSSDNYFDALHIGSRFRLFYRQAATTVSASIASVYTRVSSTLDLITSDYAVGDEVRDVVGSEEYFYTCIATYTTTGAGWLTATVHAVNDVVTNGGASYLCIVGHTSGDTDDEPGVGATEATYWLTTTAGTDVPTYFEPGCYMIASTRLAGRWDFTTEDSWTAEMRVQTSPDDADWTTVSTMVTTVSGTNFTTGDDELDAVYVRVVLVHSDSAHGDMHNLAIGQYDVPGVVEITAVAGAGSATATVIDDLYSSGNAEKWEVEAWNALDGYVRAVGFEDNRLTFAGSKNLPIDKWHSETNNYSNHIASTLADGPFKISAIGFDASPTQWLSSHDGTFMGTASAEATLNPTDTSKATSPENLPIVRWFSNEGSAFLPPVFLNSRLFALQASKEKLSEFAYSIERGFNGGYDPSEATLLAEHILATGVKQMTIRRMPEKGIWCVLESGDVVVFTHRPKAKMAGWWRFQSGGDIKSVAVVRGDGTEDKVYMAVLRDSVIQLEKVSEGNMGKRRAMEGARLANDDATVLFHASRLRYLDCSTTITGTAMTTVTVARFANTVVNYLMDGVERTATADATGIITLEEPADVVLVGLPFTTTIEPRSLEAFQQFESTMSRRKTAKEAVISYYLSVGGEVQDLSGPTQDISPLQLADDNPVDGRVFDLQTNQRSIMLSGEAERKKKLRITHSQAYPFTLLGLHVEMEGHEQ